MFIQAKSNFWGFLAINEILTGTETICRMSKSIFRFLALNLAIFLIS